MDKPEESTEIDINEPVALTFALRYLNSFAKVVLRAVVQFSQQASGPASPQQMHPCTAGGRCAFPLHLALCCCVCLHKDMPFAAWCDPLS